jgi:hypothetical protein
MSAVDLFEERERLMDSTKQKKHRTLLLAAAIVLLFTIENRMQADTATCVRNDTGEIEGVKYGQLTTVLVNAVNQQQSLIEKLQQQNHKLQEQTHRQQVAIDGLKKLVCRQYPTAEVCKEGQK